MQPYPTLPRETEVRDRRAYSVMFGMLVMRIVRRRPGRVELHRLESLRVISKQT